ncbi:alkaline phosphatase PafA [Chitinophaga sp. XS-30]|uniref:alkaline phosphatase PafA n=1 Tax=Chitinophaga sp. XS-30 TaxID=2604421 RepID=UPI0011DC9CDB|nr:alkaline phosphatase PafA [Chitinophaga sp. XS-30]QEH43446.1 alkaline phosphatase family protein [Chitinophaga sp. XS-30]
MSRIKFLTVTLLMLGSAAFAQKAGSANGKGAQAISRPKLVVGMVVDQMRWDYLYRYADRYTSNGFKRLLNEGFSCENTFINYMPTYTACGHTCVYTGSVPAVHGITGNNWYDKLLGRSMYCTEDTSARSVGTPSSAGKMSPRNMHVSTIGDELRLATNFRSKVVGIAIKDRGAILPAGHSANAAYWYDGSTGNFVTSDYYMKELPSWVSDFNAQRLPAKYLSQPWNTLYPIETYKQSTEDDKPYEGRFRGAKNAAFPHVLAGTMGDGFGVLASSPYGNTFTLEFAKKALDNYALGKGDFTDFLAVSLSSTDYIGHQHGPNSIEIEDTYLRLDKDLAGFFSYLDQHVGKGQWLFFITADHGVGHVPGFLEEKKFPNGIWKGSGMMKTLNEAVQKEFGVEKVLTAAYNYQFTFDQQKLKASGKAEEIKALIIEECLKYPGVSNAFDLQKLGAQALPEPQKTMVTNGYYPMRCGDIMVVLHPGWLDGGATGTTHGLWNPYDSHIPLVWMGWGIQKGKSNRTMGMTDIAPTIAAMLRIQMPNGNVGHVIEEITK